MKDITQENLYLIIPLKVSVVAGMLQEDSGMDCVEAIKRIYSSKMYRRLEREETKTWTLGPTTLYYDLIHE